MSPDYIGALTPAQTAKIRLGRFSRYAKDGGGHQPWNEVLYPCQARVGSEKSNPYYKKPWQPIWVPTTGWVTIPNLFEVKLDKKLEIGGIQVATLTIDNILYPDAGGYHVRQRGAMSPLRGYYAHGDEEAPDIPQLLDELGLVVPPNEWEGRFSYEAQVTIYQGYGTALAKTFTGLIEDVDITSHPDKIILTARDFGKVFTENHIFGWNKDPVINTPVYFVDREQGSGRSFVGYNPHASSEDKPAHEPEDVIDGDKRTYWRSALVHTSEWTEYIEIALPEGIYTNFDMYIPKGYNGMEAYLSLRPNIRSSGKEPERNGVTLRYPGKGLTAEGWVDLAEIEGGPPKIVPGEHGGVPWINHYASGTVLAGRYLTPFFEASEKAEYVVGSNTVLRVSFRKLPVIGTGNRAGCAELHGRRLALTAAGEKAEWVLTEDISDVVRILCQWAGFKEWDIDETGIKLPNRIVADKEKTYLDIIKGLAEKVGFNFYMADPKPDGEPIDSLGVPTFKKTRVVNNDLEGIPTITDRSLLTAIKLHQTSEPLHYVIRVYGISKNAPGDPSIALASGKRLVYTFRPPWAGTPPEYTLSRLAGILKQVVYKEPYLSTAEDVRQAAWFIALQEALESIQATIEFPAYPGLDLDDHALLMDLGTGVTTRIAVAERSSTFTDGEHRRFTMTVTGPLIDTPDIRDMVNIINEIPGVEPNGTPTEWGNPTEGTPSSLGYG